MPAPLQVEVTEIAETDTGVQLTFTLNHTECADAFTSADAGESVTPDGRRRAGIAGVPRDARLRLGRGAANERPLPRARRRL